MPDIINSEFYGDQVRWFVGVVVAVGEDEPRLGRVKVRIYGIHGNESQVPEEDLPYAQTLVPTTEPGVSGLGRNPYLQPGATVFGVFLDGKHSQSPLVLGSIPTVQTPSITQLNNQSQDEKFNDVTKQTQGFTVPGTPGTGTGGRTGIQSALAGGLDSFNVDPDAPAGTNVQIAWEYFKSLGRYPDAAIAGLLGNFLAESGSGSPIDIRTSATGDIGLKVPEDQSFGIAQWYNMGGDPNSRFAQLIAFCDRIGKPKEDLLAQLAFVDWELSNTRWLGGEELKKKPTATLAAIHVHRKYERPALEKPEKLSPVDGQPMRLHEAKRIKYAKMVYNHFTRKAQ